VKRAEEFIIVMISRAVMITIMKSIQLSAVSPELFCVSRSKGISHRIGGTGYGSFFMHSKCAVNLKYKHKGNTMAKVMLRYDSKGEISFYVAKKDMEETIKKAEFDTDEKWGGEVELSNGETWYIEPGVKKFPSEVMAVRRGD